MNVKRIDGGTQELPLYQCHKRVRAVLIERIDYDNDKGEFVITPEAPADLPLVPFIVPKGFMNKHSPKPGWWVVQYEDGYMSASPPKEFVNGYKRVTALEQRRTDLERELDQVNDAIEAAQRAAQP
jgi:hypothetical protein